ncbi:MAG: DUF924 domain-containing protein [Colwellia sp.]|nr:DUF924 domain-containing protein [Colwellia sp.]
MHNNILKFWFEQLTPQQWWQKSDDLDNDIQQKFGDLHQQASQAELYPWRDSAKGCLAEIIILDQFSRNIFRNTAKSFAQDSLALVLAQQAIAVGVDKELNAIERNFLYMPFMHSESLIIHQQACPLYKANGVDSSYQFELKHYDIIKQFGRYPHRNIILNRASTAEEIEFLKQPNSSF